ncbi:hypothetical protein [Kitasatospora brasiliensis]|uniref:hypothetical protein n=1 Tax=Kitasatospora brasiliensis TaxID=3058040 RepID=UPI00292D4756|nr:hypothetical protein [Kitasatospora sp. K002]
MDYQASVPHQQPYGPPPDPPPSPHAKSEATRLMCAGVYLDPEFRRRVIGELVEHDERTVPPSLGFDAITVLAHALRARVLELRTGAVLAAIWLGFAYTSIAPAFEDTSSGGLWGPYDGRAGGYGSYAGSASDQPFGSLAEHLPAQTTNFAVAYALVTLVSWFAKPARVREYALYAPATPGGTRATARRSGGFRTAGAVILQLWYWVAAVVSLFHSHPEGALFPLALAATIGGHRLLVAQLVRRELSRGGFGDGTPLALPDRPYYRRLRRAIAAEQDSQLIVYDPADPFLGAGFPYRAWSFSLELKRRQTGPVAVPDGELTARAVLELVVPRLADLRQATADTSLDRLRDLEIDHVVFLPYGPTRGNVPRGQADITQHIAEAVDEGGERRRHFLRVRVGAWDEQVVLTVHLRVHTQGGLLVLEVVPHVLGPVWREYELLADAAAQQGTRLRRSRPAVSAFTAGPAALRALVRPGGRAGAAEEADAAPVSARPMVSLRESASSRTVSIFQELDINRYLKTIQERVIDGVREALHRQGYETGRFEQTVVQVMAGGIHIGEMSGGAVATNGGTATSKVNVAAQGNVGPAAWQGSAENT